MNKGPLLRVITAHLQAHPRSLWQTKHDTLPPRRTRVEWKDWSASSRMANKPQRRIKGSGRSMHGADVSTLPSDPQLFNTFVRFFGLIFLKSVAKIAAVCNDLSKTELSLQSRALFGDSCCQNMPKLVSMDPFHRKFTNRKQTVFLPSKTEGLLVSNSLQYSSNKSWMLGAFN